MTLKLDCAVPAFEPDRGQLGHRQPRRRALATSSMPISKPASDSMPTSRTKSVEYALNEFVASRVPTRASQ